MNMIPKNSEVVHTKVNRKNEVVLVMRSPCRHYSAVTLKLDGGTVYVTKTKNRCGLSAAFSMS